MPSDDIAQDLLEKAEYSQSTPLITRHPHSLAERVNKRVSECSSTLPSMMAAAATAPSARTIQRILLSSPLLLLPLATSHPSTFPPDLGSLDLTILNTIYGISLIESTRSSAPLLLRYPVAYALLALCQPTFALGMYLFMQYTLCDVAAAGELVAGRRRVDGVSSRFVFPLIALLMVLLPGILGVREGWYWGIAVVAVQGLSWLGGRVGCIKGAGGEGEEDGGADGGDLASVKAAVWGLVGLGALAWVYWVCRAVRSWALEVMSADLVVLAIIVVYWTALLVHDVKQAGLADGVCWTKTVASGFLFMFIGGPGAVAALGWLFREETFTKKPDAAAVEGAEHIDTSEKMIGAGQVEDGKA